MRDLKNDTKLLMETPIAKRLASPRLPCGHPAELLVKSIESDYQFCELCEATKMLGDAILMEFHHKAEVKRLAGLLDQARADADHHRHCVTCGEDGCPRCFECQQLTTPKETAHAE